MASDSAIGAESVVGGYDFGGCVFVGVCGGGSGWWCWGWGWGWLDGICVGCERVFGGGFDVAFELLYFAFDLFFLEFEFLESLGGFLFIYGGNCRGCDGDGFGVDGIEHERVELVLILFGYGLFRGLDRFPLVFLCVDDVAAHEVLVSGEFGGYLVDRSRGGGSGGGRSVGGYDATA